MLALPPSGVDRVSTLLCSTGHHLPFASTSSRPVLVQLIGDRDERQPNSQGGRVHTDLRTPVRMQSYTKPLSRIRKP